MSDRTYIYGMSNGGTYIAIEGEGADGERRTHWDPRVEISAPGHGAVMVGVVPPSEGSTIDTGLWDPSDGQFLSLDWAGCNRLIRSIREARDATFGTAE